MSDGRRERERGEGRLLSGARDRYSPPRSVTKRTGIEAPPFAPRALKAPPADSHGARALGETPTETLRTGGLARARRAVLR